MEIEEENIEEIYDKNGFIKDIVESCNIITKEKKVEDLLDPVRTMITMDSSYYKLFVIIFNQIFNRSYRISYIN